MRDMLMPPVAGEKRTPEQLYQHYMIERELADRLRRSRRDERATLYSTVYNELFRRVPLHPQLTRVISSDTVAMVVKEKMQVLSHFLKPATTFLEIGAGDCRLALEVARHVRNVYALDVSADVSKGIASPGNFRFVLSNGTDIPLAANSVDVAYSYQLIEHVQPEDAVEQLHNLYKVLAPGGIYICITPNRLAGPHDISRYFDREATGFHLKEYTIAELARLFRQSGFEDVFAFPGTRGRFARIGVGPITVLESWVAMLPWPLRHRIARLPLVTNVLMSAIVAVKKCDTTRSIVDSTYRQ
jgi:ubiquinone/menaquinone biosynthesis C-methylase UbiE